MATDNITATTSDAALIPQYPEADTTSTMKLQRQRIPTPDPLALSAIHQMLLPPTPSLSDKEVSTCCVKGYGTNNATMRGADTEVTVSSTTTETATVSIVTAARYNYTGLYRLSILYDDTQLQPRQLHLLPLGGYIAFRPIPPGMRMDISNDEDEYNVAIATYANSRKILTTRFSIAPCIDYTTGSMPMEYDEMTTTTTTTVVPQEQQQPAPPPYDDIVNIGTVQWATIPTALTPQQQSTNEMDDIDTDDDDSTTRNHMDDDDDDVLLPDDVQSQRSSEMAEIDRLEHLFTTILTKCDMIQFIGGDRLVLEGPKGAIECIMEDEENYESTDDGSNDEER